MTQIGPMRVSPGIFREVLEKRSSSNGLKAEGIETRSCWQPSCHQESSSEGGGREEGERDD